MSGYKAGHICIMVVFPKHLVRIQVDLFCKETKIKLGNQKLNGHQLAGSVHYKGK